MSDDKILTINRVKDCWHSTRPKIKYRIHLKGDGRLFLEYATDDRWVSVLELHPEVVKRILVLKKLAGMRDKHKVFKEA